MLLIQKNVANVPITIKGSEYRSLILKAIFYDRLMGTNNDVLISIKDENSKFLDVNQAQLRFLGAKSKEDVIGKTDYDFFERMYADQSLADEKEILLSQSAFDGKHELVRYTEDDKQVWLSTTKSYSEDSSGRGTVCISRNISNQKKDIYDKVDSMFIDQLTKVFNREQFKDVLPQDMILSKKSSQKLALAFIDLNGLKAINDNFGHGVGDAFLIELAKRLRACDFRKADKIFRIGGDEFVIIFPYVKSLENLPYIAEKILKVFDEPMFLQGHMHQISGSVGLSLFPDHTETWETLLNYADKAMYVAKALSKEEDALKSGYHIYKPEVPI